MDGDLEHAEHFARFISLFKYDYDKISCVLLATGDYWQVDGNGWRYQLGSEKPVFTSKVMRE